LESSGGSGAGTPVPVDGEPIKREKTGRMYKLVTREYLAQGHDGYEPLRGRNYLVDDENGQLMSSLVRKYLLGEFSWTNICRAASQCFCSLAGSRYVNRMARFRDESKGTDHMHTDTADVVKREVDHRKRHANGDYWPNIAQKWQQATTVILHKLRSRGHYLDNINITAREHMSGVDCFNGKKVRRGGNGSGENGHGKGYSEDLPVIHPVADGRIKDVARN
jgi:5'-nucleotidase